MLCRSVDAALTQDSDEANGAVNANGDVVQLDPERRRGACSGSDRRGESCWGGNGNGGLGCHSFLWRPQIAEAIK